MNELQVRRNYWERKILRWERMRYSPWLTAYPPSWPLRARLKIAHKSLLERAPAHWSILELACGSGLLAAKLKHNYKKYSGIDIAKNAIAQARARCPEFQFSTHDIFSVELRPADVTVFLGLTDWLVEGDFSRLLSKVNSHSILFSYTRVSAFNPYRFYRLSVDRPRRGMKARCYSEFEIREVLSLHGFSYEVLSASIFNPGVLVWAQR